MRRALYIDGDLVGMLRVAAQHEKMDPNLLGPDAMQRSSDSHTMETLAEQIIREWMQTRPYGKLQERLDAARKAEEERFWREQEKPL